MNQPKQFIRLHTRYLSYKNHASLKVSLRSTPWRDTSFGNPLWWVTVPGINDVEIRLAMFTEADWVFITDFIFGNLVIRHLLERASLPMNVNMAIRETLRN